MQIQEASEKLSPKEKIRTKMPLDEHDGETILFEARSVKK